MEKLSLQNRIFISNNSIAVLDYGSQYSQLITRVIRESHVYSELFPWDAAKVDVLKNCPKGFILSGGPNSVYDKNAPYLPDYVIESGLPILGICYGMQLLAITLDGKVIGSDEREYGLSYIDVLSENPLIPKGTHSVWMSHGDRINDIPAGYKILASSLNSPVACMGDVDKKRYGVQFHPEVRHTPIGRELIRRFVVDICGVTPDWTSEKIIKIAVDQIETQVKNKAVLATVSGGVDSSVATALVQKAVGSQLKAVFVDNGLLRKGERQQVESVFKNRMGENLIIADAADRFLHNLKNITDPERKRKVIGETFIRVFEEEAARIGKPGYLVQGTIYPDVIESSAPDRSKGDRIKSHHNVGGLPNNFVFDLVEPLRYLFKDEVRLVGEALGLPVDLVWRQPFPGPGLAVRCLGEITKARLDCLRDADAIFISELQQAGLMVHSHDHETGRIAQAFAVLLPIQSVGVMGDQRTYQEVIALRAVSTSDFMTADWAKLPDKLLSKVANRIVNEVSGVNRVVYDITSKPPATIEWE